MSLSQLKSNKGHIKKYIGSKFAGAYIRIENLHTIGKKKSDAPIACIVETPGLAVAVPGYLWEIQAGEDGRSVVTISDEKKGISRYPEYDMLSQAIAKGVDKVFKDSAESMVIETDDKLHDGICSTMVDGKAHIKLKGTGDGQRVYLDYRIIRVLESIYTEVESWEYQKIEAAGGGEASRAFVLIFADDVLIAMAQPILPGQKQMKLGFSEDEGEGEGSANE